MKAKPTKQRSTDIIGTQPLAVLLDRSRDGGCGEPLLWLPPRRVFQVTDNRRRVTKTRLADYDVLTVLGNSPHRHAPTELKAMRDFVRRGGGLVLAAGAGAFEHGTGLATTRLGANRIAHLFGFEFLSAADLPTNLNDVRGFGREQLTLTAAGRRLGIGVEEMMIERAAPLSVPGGATVLMRGPKAQPIAALARYGRGRILVMGDLGVWNAPWNYFATAHWLMLAVDRKARPAGRRHAPDRASGRISHRRSEHTLPAILSTTLGEVRHGPVTITYQGTTRDQARATLKLAVEIWDQATRLFPGKPKPRRWHITLEPGCSGLSEEWQESMDELCHRFGADLAPAALAAEMAYCVALCLSRFRMGWMLLPFSRSAAYYVQAIILQTLGFTAHAEQLQNACRDDQETDLGRFYQFEEETAVARRFWSDVADRFGERAFPRCMGAMPAKQDDVAIYPHLYSGLDQIAFYLTTAMGPSVYSWLTSRGHSVRRIPPGKPGTDKHMAALDRSHRRMLFDPDRPASERYDALCILGERLADQKVALDTCARRARGRQPGKALPAAARLLLAGDMRGQRAARRYLRHGDPGLAAAVALLLASEALDPDACTLLVALAPHMDTRFQLSVGHALERAGDRRARRFSFHDLPGCDLLTYHDRGMKKVFPTVNGRPVANTWCMCLFWPMPSGSGFSTWYIEWVHTAPRWRRRGLARLAMTASLDSPWDRICATTSLHTGTSNAGHPLYREYGLQDYWVMQTASQPLRTEQAARAPRGMSIRKIAPGDAQVVSDLLRDTLDGRPGFSSQLRTWPLRGPAYLAYDGRRPAGFVSACPGEKGSARLEYLTAPEAPHPKIKSKATAQDSERVESKAKQSRAERREKIGLALLSRLHRELLKQGYKKVERQFFGPTLDDFHIQLLQHAGYAVGRGWAVEMHRINDLARFFQELAPLFERRLSDSDTWRNWSGTIKFAGQRLRATLNIENGRVRGSSSQSHPRRVGATPLIRVLGSDAAIQRIAFGTQSLIEEHLQIEVRIEPTPGKQMKLLLECLFPRDVR